MKLRVKSTGDIKGSVKEKGKEGLIELISVNHQLSTSRDAGSGQATGKRQHKPFVFVKETDATTPKFYEMLVKNDPIEEAAISFYGPAAFGPGSSQGVEKKLYTITLKGGAIADVQLAMPNNREKPEQLPALGETISIVYQTIEWIFHEGNIVAQDVFSAGT